MIRTGRTSRLGGPRGFLSESCGKKRGVCISVVALAVLIAACLLAYTAFANNDEATLRQVFILFRHGDRNPTETYPNDPYLHYEWPNGWGALTKKGMRQLYDLGVWLRGRYGWLTNDKYNSSVTDVQSSYADRCIASALSLLAGFFPPRPEDTFVDGLPWQPIPVHYNPRSIDKLIVVKAPCPRRDKALAQAYAEEAAKSDVALADYYKELTKLTGKPMENITDLEYLYNTLDIEVQNGLKLPDWIAKYYSKEMKLIAARSLAIFTHFPIQRRLVGGPLLKELLTNMNRSLSGESSRKVHLYGIHDVTIVNVLRSMGFLWEDLKPEYGASILVELHSKQSESEVKVFYVDDTEKLAPRRLQVPDCSEPCTLKKLNEAWNSVIPDNWDRECLL